MNGYEAVHFFLDESGNLAGALRTRAPEPLLVGGALLFGGYGQAANDQLRQILVQRLTEVGGEFPEDLHFSKSRLAAKDKEAFLRAVDADLRDWAGSERAIYGVSLSHHSDIFADANSLLDEREYDNRYVAMVWSLVEHLVFVDDKVAERLRPQAKLHLYIANRSYRFDLQETTAPLSSSEPKRSSAKPISQADVEALGWKVLPDTKAPGRFFIPRVLDRTEVRGMLRLSLRHRWPRASISLGHIDVPSIDYKKKGTSPAGLYLADLYLGQVRSRLQAERYRARPQVRSVLLSSFRDLEYGPGLEALARLQAALAEEDIDSYLALAARYSRDKLLADSSPAAERQVKRAAQILANQPEKLSTFLEAACRTLDSPGLTSIGIRQVDHAARLLRAGRVSQPRVEFLLLQARLSYANHTGDVEKAETVWNDYLQLEPKLVALGADGLRLKAGMRNRRAVSLTDQFRYVEAEDVLTELVSAQEDQQSALARAFGIEVDEVPSRELGACYGTLGQVYAFMGTGEQYAAAERCFRRALAVFTDPADSERQWAYLGHLACDQGSAGRPLWDTVTKQLIKLCSPRPLADDGEQYLLALQLKGILVFATPARLQRYLEHWEQERPLEQFPPAALAAHPFGLIHQSLAMSYARAWRETGREREEYSRAAREHFERASAHLMSGEGALLKALAYVSQLRRCLFDLEVEPGGMRPRNALRKAFLSLKGCLMERFGEHAWSEDEAGHSCGQLGRYDPGLEDPVERAQPLVAAIRFNFW